VKPATLRCYMAEPAKFPSGVGSPIVTGPVASPLHLKVFRGESSTPPLAALCVSGRSIYKHLPGVVAYDRKRDARTFDAKTPAVAHPPCRFWSKFLSVLALKAARANSLDVDVEAEKELGRWCVRTVMRCGGVLEQPAHSGLWADMGLPMPNQPARDGCWTLYVEQGWFGYLTRKPTWLLICGVPKDQLPPVPFSLVNGSRANSPGLSAFARSRTVNSFAEWLVKVARLAKPPAADGTPDAVYSADAPRRQQDHDGTASSRTPGTPGRSGCPPGQPALPP
jgi:hypothetical protein